MNNIYVKENTADIVSKITKTVETNLQVYVLTAVQSAIVPDAVEMRQ